MRCFFKRLLAISLYLKQTLFTEEKMNHDILARNNHFKQERPRRKLRTCLYEPRGLMLEILIRLLPD